MRSFDRTLLASLGFSDSDKADRRHDLACQYLCSPEIAVVVAQTYWSASKRLHRHTVPIDRTVAVTKSQVELHITKGEGQYRTTIGFADVFLETEGLIAEEAESWSEASRRWLSDGTRIFKNWFDILVEVKIKRVAVGDLIRQIKLYAEYVRRSHLAKGVGFVAACAFDFSNEDIAQLMTESIVYVKLGGKFDRYCEERLKREETVNNDRFEI